MIHAIFLYPNYPTSIFYNERLAKYFAPKLFQNEEGNLQEINMTNISLPSQDDAWLIACLTH